MLVYKYPNLTLKKSRSFRTYAPNLINQFFEENTSPLSTDALKNRSADADGELVELHGRGPVSGAMSVSSKQVTIEQFKITAFGLEFTQLFEGSR